MRVENRFQSERMLIFPGMRRHLRILLALALSPEQTLMPDGLRRCPAWLRSMRGRRNLAHFLHFAIFHPNMGKIRYGSFTMHIGHFKEIHVIAVAQFPILHG